MKIIHKTETEQEKFNLWQKRSEVDSFTKDRYTQMFNYFPRDRSMVLDVGCNTGRGGEQLKNLAPDMIIHGIDIVQSRLDQLPPAYSDKIKGSVTDIPLGDFLYSAIVAGEFIEHIAPADIDKTLCEFHRILKIGGRLLITTPNPGYIKNRNRTILHTAHVSQHYPKILKHRLLMHGYSNVKIRGSGRAILKIGDKLPLLFYGSFLIMADKY